ncbi:MAG: RNA polymerase sigma factor [Saprospiraceae bacterium]|nr:RNA polymerase sigma factor [Saprospiraceae bacterium]
MTDQTIEALLKGCKKGDRRSQQVVYEHFYATVMNVCLRYASSREEARELTNESFFKAFTHLERFKEGSNFGGWLYTIARRTALDRYRVAIQQPEKVSESELPHWGGAEPEKRILDRLDIEEKLRLVQKLPPAYRAVFNLYVVEEYTHDEIAGILDISVGASKSNLSKARTKLRELMEKELYTGI